MGIYLEGLIHVRAYFQNFKVFKEITNQYNFKSDELMILVGLRREFMN